MSQRWNDKLANRTLDFSPREVFDLISQMPDSIQAEIIIEILCESNKRCIAPVLKWIEENKSDLEGAK